MVRLNEHDAVNPQAIVLINRISDLLFAMARRAWARRGLMVSAAFSAVACFALVLNAPLVLIPAAAAVAS